ncbi:sensor histidine kinase [Flavobacterium suncheonense]|uniref:sensor histidine kinase n=1 Tax=Flavobacterium suncheonense TaxID=350894 RepID=UPI00040C03DF|nr:HAMP domain-containing sensor histidine kinase [Flavobacterium suncheonense]
MKLFLRNNIAPLIALTVTITVGIQVYWNIQNYQNNKKQIINIIQLALDNSIDNYYNDKAKAGIVQSFTLSVPKTLKKKFSDDSDEIIILEPSTKSRIPQLYNNHLDSKDLNKNRNDSLLEIKNMKLFAEKAIISIRQDSIDINKLATYLSTEFTNKKLDFEYALYKREGKKIIKYNNPDNKKFLFSVNSKSAYLPRHSELKLFYPDIFFKTLKEGIAGILLSFVFSLSIIFCLFYLLSVIRQQKQLAIIKNDFISNISHELKTPIAVVSSALEGIEKFNTDNEPEKTKKYLSISKQHLSKLHQIVEKILETSALESDKLQLQVSNTEIVQLINHTIEKLKINTEKKIQLRTSKREIDAYVDSFHFENVVSNLVDNAIKYGGDEITITVNNDNMNLVIEISDNGKAIEKIHQQKIFDKFYRIPQNNLHTEKGFGIGLYYAKNIIAKHGGTLELISDEQLTTFKILIPNE